jgi:hypothetical protein
VIDHLVDACRNGQGQIAARRVRAAVWNENASAEFLHDQHEINLLLGAWLQLIATFSLNYWQRRSSLECSRP